MIERMQSLEECTVVLPDLDLYIWPKGHLEKIAAELARTTAATLAFDVEGDGGYFTAVQRRELARRVESYCLERREYRHRASSSQHVQRPSQ